MEYEGYCKADPPRVVVDRIILDYSSLFLLFWDMLEHKKRGEEDEKYQWQLKRSKESLGEIRRGFDGLMRDKIKDHINYEVSDTDLAKLEELHRGLEEKTLTKSGISEAIKYLSQRVEDLHDHFPDADEMRIFSGRIPL